MFDFRFAFVRIACFLICFSIFSCQDTNTKTAINNKTKASQNVDTLKRQVKKLANDCSFDNDVSSVGIGLIIAPEKYVVFNDSLLTDTFEVVDMYGSDMNSSRICPMFYKPDYGIMHFICLEKSKNYFKVLNGFDEFKFLRVDKSLTFKTWDSYILQSMGIRRRLDARTLKSVSQPLRKAIASLDTLVIPKGHELFCPMQITGDWVQVNYDCFYNDENNKHEEYPCHSYINECVNPLNGWLRWREKNKILIDIFLLP